MHGSTDHPIFLYALTAISLIAAFTDLVWGRIFNWLTFSSVLAGLAASFALLGWQGGASSLIGVAFALVAYGALFWAGAMAGGDVKLLMGLAAWGGLHYAIEVAILAILLGGALAFATLLVTGRILGFYRRMSWFFATVIVRELSIEKPRIDWQLKMPFGIPIAAAAIWAAYAHPFMKWGILTWNG